MDQARKNLKGKDFSIFDDIPKELYEARKKQLKKFKEARDKGKSVYFSKAHPDKLFIDGKYVPLNEPLNRVFVFFFITMTAKIDNLQLNERP